MCFIDLISQHLIVLNARFSFLSFYAIYCFTDVISTAVLILLNAASWLIAIFIISFIALKKMYLCAFTRKLYWERMESFLN